MLYRIKFISEEVDGFLREIKIDSDANFLDLNAVILKSCGYSDDQMTSFYVCDEDWERGRQITREDTTDPDCEDEDPFLMSATPLADFIDDEGQRFEFVFDPFTERSFFLQVKEVIPGEHLAEAEIVRSKGEAPVQLEPLDMEVVAPKSAVKTGENEFEDDADFYDDGAFDAEDFDPEGFEFSDGQPY